MRGDQLARQWRILRSIEASKQGLTVADLVAQEGCHPPDDFDLDDYMRDAFGVIRTDVEKVLIRFDSAVERYLKENIWHPSQVFITQSNILFA